MRRRRKVIAELEALRQELDVLRAENARLRLERQTAASVGGAAEQARALPATVAQLGDEDEGDAAATMLAHAVMIRSSVLNAVEELQTTFAHLHQQMETGAPAAELDRRVRDRRGDRRVDAGPTGAQPSMERGRVEPQRHGRRGHAGGTTTSGASGRNGVAVDRG